MNDRDNAGDDAAGGPVDDEPTALAAVEQASLAEGPGAGRVAHGDHELEVLAGHRDLAHHARVISGPLGDPGAHRPAEAVLQLLASQRLLGVPVAGESRLDQRGRLGDLLGKERPNSRPDWSALVSTP